MIARPTLPALTPGGTVDSGPPSLSINAGNPFLDPIRANTYDVSFEWYPYPEALFAIAFFQKDIETFIQRLRQSIPYSETGFPDSYLQNGATSSDVFDVQTFVNTPGGDLSGFEITLQTPFTFLPAPFDGFGGQLSYTDIDSEVAYVVSATTAGSAFVNAPIVGQSPTSIAATLYYENGPFEARISGVSRDEYLTLVPAVSRQRRRGQGRRSSTSTSLRPTTSTTTSSLTFEAINLTDQFDERWINSVRKNSLNYEHTGSEFVVGLRYKN